MAAVANIGGIISGLPTEEIISKMLSYKERPVNLLNARKTVLTEKLTAWQSVNARLLAVRMSAQELSSAQAFKSKSVTSSNTEALTATASSVAPEGTYTLKVLKLAKAHQIASASNYESATADGVGSGSITIANASTGKSTTVNIAAGADSLEAVRDAINAASTDAIATIVSDGSDAPYRLLLASRITGSAGELDVTTDLSGGLGLSFDGPTSVITDADDAQLQIGSTATPIVVTSSSNVITTAIPGVSLNLLAADDSGSITVSVRSDTELVRKKISAFVQSYNGFVDYVKSVDSYDTQTKEGGPLLGDFTLQTMQSDLTGILNRSVTGLTGSVQALTDVGIRLGSDGKLSIDEAALSAALSANPDAVTKVFARSGQTTDSGIVFLNATAQTKQTSGTGVVVDVTQLATQTHVTAGRAMDAPLGADEMLTLNTVKIGLRASMSLEDVVRTINAETSKTGVMASATLADGTGQGNWLTFTQGSFGSAPAITVISDRSVLTASTSGVGTTPITGLAPAGESGLGTGSAGLDVAGTINGEAARGTGKTLTGVAGNPSTDGLAVLVNSGSTGRRGYVSYSSGVASSSYDLLSALTDVSTGTLTTTQQSIQDQMNSLDVQMNSLLDRLALEEERIRSQFATMEAALSKIQTQGQYLSAQITALSGLNSSK